MGVFEGVESMKRVGIVVLTIMIVMHIVSVSKARASYFATVVGLASSASTWVQSLKSYKVPAKVACSATSGGVTTQGVKWIALNIPQVRMAKIVTGLLVIGGSSLVGYMTSEMSDWIADNGLYYNNDGQLSTTEEQLLPDPQSSGHSIGSVLSYGAYGDYPVYVMSYHQSESDAKTACTAIHGSFFQASLYANEWQPDLNWAAVAYRIDNGYGAVPRYEYFGYVYPKKTAVTVALQEVEVPADTSVIEDALADDFDNETQTAIDIGSQAISIVGDAISNTNHPIRKYPSMWAEIKSQVDQSITEAQMEDVVGEYVDEETWAETIGQDVQAIPNPVSAVDVKNAVIEALTAKGLSSAQIQAVIEAAIAAKADVFAGSGGLSVGAITDAINDALVTAGIASTADMADAIADAIADVAVTPTEITEAIEAADIATVPEEPTITPPEKNSLTDILLAFMTDLGNLEILDVFERIEIEESGASSIMCIPLPEDLGGGNACYDFGDWGDALGTIGNIMASINGIFWILWLFRDSD